MPKTAALELLSGPSPSQAIEDPREFTTKQSQDSIEVLSISDRIQTAEQAFAEGGFDPAIWYYDQAEVTSYECAMKLKNADKSQRPVIIKLWRIKLRLRRRVAPYVEKSSEALIARMDAHSPKFPRFPRLARVRDPHLLEVSIFDTHFGKLAWQAETGNNYDLKIAQNIYREAVEDLLAKASGFPIERILFPIGNDFFHIDNLESKTTAGTPQDVDGRYWKIYDTGVQACIDAVEYLMQVAPVDVLWVPGNHDAVASGHLARSLNTFFRKTPRVSVDAEPLERKYYPYGPMVLGFTHGNEEKPSDLVPIMQNEARALLATRSLEIHRGHRHKAKEVVHTNADTFAGGVRVRDLPSLSGTDKWHYKHGYFGPRAAEAYVWSKETGFSALLSANVRVDSILKRRNYEDSPRSRRRAG